MALKQQIMTRPVLVIAMILCAVLFAYVILTPRHESVDQVVNPSAHQLDQQILGNARVALPLRHPVPAKFGNPTNGPNLTTVTTTASGVATTAGNGAVSKPPVTSMPTTGTATSVPLSTRPAYTVLIKAPGDRTRKAVVVNH
jgi:hypothetical protein